MKLPGNVRKEAGRSRTNAHSYLKAFAYAEDDLQSPVNGRLGFPGNELYTRRNENSLANHGLRPGYFMPGPPISVCLLRSIVTTYVIILLQNHPTLTMSHNRPVDFRIPELFHAQLARERAVGLVKHVLRGHPDLWVCQAARQQEVEGWRGDHDFGVGVKLGGVEVGDDAADGFGGAVPVIIVLWLVYMRKD